MVRSPIDVLSAREGQKLPALCCNTAPGTGFADTKMSGNTIAGSKPRTDREEPPTDNDTGPSEDNHLYTCPGCSTVTFGNVDECPACGSTAERLTLGFEASGGADDPADELEDYDLVEAEAASMYDHEVVENFERHSWDDTVRKVLAEEIVERFAATLNDD